MNDARIVFSPGAEQQLVEIYRYIARAASPATARSFTDAIVERCESIRLFPHRGTRRDDVRPGLRTIGFRRRVAIAFSVGDNAVTIVGIFYGGQGYDAALRESE